MTFHKSNLSNIERRAKNLGLTMTDIEEACCDIVRNSEGLDPHKTFREVSDLKPLDVSVAEWDEPIWKVGLIYGDSITLTRAQDILATMTEQGWASGNVVFGVGSYTYQYHTRDTFGIAMKTTWAQINGEAVEVMKDPITDRGTKKSAKGLLRVEKEGNDYVLYEQQTRDQESLGELRTVFINGHLANTENLEQIRNRLLCPSN